MGDHDFHYLPESSEVAIHEVSSKNYEFYQEVEATIESEISRILQQDQRFLNEEDLSSETISRVPFFFREGELQLSHCPFSGCGPIMEARFKLLCSRLPTELSQARKTVPIQSASDSLFPSGLKMTLLRLWKEPQLMLWYTFFVLCVSPPYKEKDSLRAS